MSPHVVHRYSLCIVSPAAMVLVCWMAAFLKQLGEKATAECTKHGWKLVPFAVERLGATNQGTEAARLLQHSAAHSTVQPPVAFPPSR